MYSCQIWVKSIDIKNINLWIKLLPLKFILSPLPVKVKRFTLLRSPLGNKKSKEQYQLVEHGIYLLIFDSKASNLLYFLEIIRKTVNVKLKIKFLKT
uniref:ribosomal protein S10 n=1 Tax=Dictyotopsis propagulifera TaxID=670095 RepID=UPI002E7985A9|nr:ribosomal protein S10 [Dictyotopsis propagulifera]WBP69938.1 ribosomal protein S10 [Dictyotopsis propagulifera]